MRPSFVKQSNFDSEMTRFAGKYTLYLYREKGADSSDQVRAARNKQHKRGNQWQLNRLFFLLAHWRACLVHPWSCW
jgi:hypothetical protein